MRALNQRIEPTSFPLSGCGGIVLCGGQSRRMGRSKPHLPWGDGTLLSHIVGQLQPIVRPVVVVAAVGQQLPDLPPAVIVARDRHRDQGPLEGISVGLQQLPAGAEFAYVTSCDSPLVQAEFVAALYRQRAHFEVIVPREPKYHHPLSAIYHHEVTGRIDRLLQAGKRRPIFLFELAATLEVDVETLRECDPKLATLQNANTPEEYERLFRESH